jgi:hypothetical protein
MKPMVQLGALPIREGMTSSDVVFYDKSESVKIFETGSQGERQMGTKLQSGGNW